MSDSFGLSAETAFVFTSLALGGDSGAALTIGGITLSLGGGDGGGAPMPADP
jgi:hypothetical protein